MFAEAKSSQSARRLAPLNDLGWEFEKERTNFNRSFLGEHQHSNQRILILVQVDPLGLRHCKTSAPRSKETGLRASPLVGAFRETPLPSLSPSRATLSVSVKAPPLGYGASPLL